MREPLLESATADATAIILLFLRIRISSRFSRRKGVADAYYLLHSTCAIVQAVSSSMYSPTRMAIWLASTSHATQTANRCRATQSCWMHRTTSMELLCGELRKALTCRNRTSSRWRYGRTGRQADGPMRGTVPKPTFIHDQQHANLRFTVLTRLIFVDVEQKLSGKEIHRGLNGECPE
jgi:hypothetical protein